MPLPKRQRFQRVRRFARRMQRASKRKIAARGLIALLGAAAGAGLPELATSSVRWAASKRVTSARIQRTRSYYGALTAFVESAKRMHKELSPKEYEAYLNSLYSKTPTSVQQRMTAKEFRGLMRNYTEDRGDPWQIERWTDPKTVREIEEELRKLEEGKGKDELTAAMREFIRETAKKRDQMQATTAKQIAKRSRQHAAVTNFQRITRFFYLPAGALAGLLGGWRISRGKHRTRRAMQALRKKKYIGKLMPKSKFGDDFVLHTGVEERDTWREDIDDLIKKSHSVTEGEKAIRNLREIIRSRSSPLITQALDQGYTHFYISGKKLVFTRNPKGAHPIFASKKIE